MSTRLPNRWGLIAPWAIFALMVLGWAAYWMVLSGETMNRLDAARAGLPNGAALRYQSAETSGFPFRLQVRMVGFEAVGPNGGGSISSPEATLAVNVLNPSQLLLFPQSPTRVLASGLDWTVRAETLESSLRLNDSGISELRVVARKAQIESRGSPASSADTLSVAMRPDPKDPAARMIAVSADGWRPKTPGLEGFAAQPGMLRAGLVVEKVNTLSSGKDPLGAWALAGASLRIETLEANLGGLRVLSEGAFSVDAARRPAGEATLEFDDVAAGLRAVAGSSTLSPTARAAAAAFADAQGLAGGAITVRLRAESGRWWIGPIDLGAAAPVYPVQ